MLELPGRSLRFTATAGSIPLYDQQNNLQAEIGFVAYTLADSERSSRPVTFALNGGPGAASAYLHLGALGPWRLPLDGPSISPSAVPTLVPNAETWLDFTDLVFIDPVNTGYSRAADDEKRYFKPGSQPTEQPLALVHIDKDGTTTLLCVARTDFQKILATHVELYEALMRLQARRIRTLFGLVEDLNTLPLRSRLAKQLLHLVRSYGVPCLADGSETRIGLQLAQEELAQLLGASRQRVNQELKTMEREGAIRIEPGGLVVRHRERLMQISEAEN